MYFLRYTVNKLRLWKRLLYCKVFQHFHHTLFRSTYLLLNAIWKTASKKILKLVVFILLIFLTVPWRRLKPPEKLDILKLVNFQNNEKIVIGMMSCAGGVESVGRGLNETKAMNESAEEPLTLIKSVLISAKLSGAKQVEFHIFTDSWLLTTTMQKTIEKFESIMGKYMEIKAYFYNVFESIPSGYERDFVDNIRRCGYVRVFFPSVLPVHLKEILYLDTDTIITGNILKIWNNFRENVVTKVPPNRPPQLAALVPNSEGTAFTDIYNDNFKRIPHVPPRGVNSGVMFMNLHAMRKFDWPKKIMKIFLERRDTLGGDQQLINVLFHYHLDKLTIFPCQYNFQHLHCEKGLSCMNVTEDPGGIQIMHGAGGTFHKAGRSHIWLFQAFKKFNLELHQEVVNRLLSPLQRLYSKSSIRGNPDGKVTCHGVIGKYLFKEFTKFTSSP